MLDCGQSENQLFPVNNKGHSLSESLYVIAPISVCDFVLTIIVTIIEAEDLCLTKAEDHIIQRVLKMSHLTMVTLMIKKVIKSHKKHKLICEVLVVNFYY